MSTNVHDSKIQMRIVGEFSRLTNTMSKCQENLKRLEIGPLMSRNIEEH